jgi:RNA-directed DNA polymerase
MKLGVTREQAYQWANTRKGCWRTAGSFLNTAITNHYLEVKGFPNLVKGYEELRARTQRLTMLHAIH